MEPGAVAGLCALLARVGAAGPSAAGLRCPPPTVAQVAAADPAARGFAARLKSAAAREAIARVAFAEAGNQGDSGLAGVVYTILNRLQDGRWGDTVDVVLNARGQFEPVSRAGGDWRALPRVSAVAQARIDTILNLALEGRLPDLTHGARFFQNPAIVAGRVRAGAVSANLVDFGGRTPSATIGAHSFYVGAGRAGEPPWKATAPASRALSPREVFVGENRAGPPGTGPKGGAAKPDPSLSTVPAGDPSQALFVSREGRVQGRPD